MRALRCFSSASKVRVVLHNFDRKGSTKEIFGTAGESLVQAVWDAQLDCLEGACDHAMACSTCQVLVDPKWLELLPKPSEEELDMLDLAFDPQDNSRLGCQIVLSSKLDGLTVAIPKGVVNILNDF